MNTSKSGSIINFTFYRITYLSCFKSRVIEFACVCFFVISTGTDQEPSIHTYFLYTKPCFPNSLFIFIYDCWSNCKKCFYLTKWTILQNKFTFVKHQLNKNKLRFGLYKQCWDSDSMFFYSQILKHTKEFISLRAKGVGEFIEKRHKKLSPTRILSTLVCLSLCQFSA